MAKLKLYSTILSKLPSLAKRDGNLIISSDSQSLYIDINGERIAITDHVDIDTDTDRLAILSPNPLKTYYVTETNKLWKYKNGEWKQITVNTDDLLCKVDKVDGKSLISDTEIARLADVHNYDDTIVKNDISSHVNSADIHVTTSDKTAWNAKQNALTKSQLDAVNSGINSTKVSAYDGYSEAISQKYSKPETGVPKTDLDEDVQISLSKADTALQSVNKSDIGLGNVGNFKAVSTVANQNLTDYEKLSARENIGAGTSSFSGSYSDLSDKPINISEFQNDVNYINKESDPTVPQHVKNITQNDITNWNSVKISEGNTVFWNEDNKLYVPMKNEVIIYTDYYVDENRLIPNIKIGDGQVPVIDLPFLIQNLSEEIISHIQDSTIHVTQNDKLKWDNKISCDINEAEENIIFYI